MRRVDGENPRDEPSAIFRPTYFPSSLFCVKPKMNQFYFDLYYQNPSIYNERNNYCCDKLLPDVSHNLVVYTLYQSSYLSTLAGAVQNIVRTVNGISLDLPSHFPIVEK